MFATKNSLAAVNLVEPDLLQKLVHICFQCGGVCQRNPRMYVLPKNGTGCNLTKLLIIGPGSKRRVHT